MQKRVVFQPLRFEKRLFSQMDLFTAITISIAVMLIITIIVMGGWLR